MASHVALVLVTHWRLLSILAGMAKAVQMLEPEMIALLDISALARQGNPSEELKLQELSAAVFCWLQSLDTRGNLHSYG